MTDDASLSRTCNLWPVVNPKSIVICPHVCHQSYLFFSILSLSVYACDCTYLNTHVIAKRKGHDEMVKWPIRSNIKIRDWRWKGEFNYHHQLFMRCDAIFMYWVLFVSIHQSIDSLPICLCRFIRTPNRTRARISSVWMLSDYDAKVMLNLTITPFIYITLSAFKGVKYINDETIRHYLTYIHPNMDRIDVAIRPPVYTCYLWARFDWM